MIDGFDYFLRNTITFTKYSKRIKYNIITKEMNNK